LDNALLAGPVPDGIYVTFIAYGIRIGSYEHLDLSRGNGSLEYEVIHAVKDELLLDELLGCNVLLEGATESHFSVLVACEVLFPGNEQLVNSFIWVLDVNVDEVPTVVARIAPDRDLSDGVFLNIPVYNRVFSIDGESCKYVVPVVSLAGLLVHDCGVTFHHLEADCNIFVFPVVELEDLMIVSHGSLRDILEGVERDLQSLSNIKPLHRVVTGVFLCQHERIVTNFSKLDGHHYYDTSRSVVAFLCPEKIVGGDADRVCSIH